jgi:hypothetical protein
MEAGVEAGSDGAGTHDGGTAAAASDGSAGAPPRSCPCVDGSDCFGRDCGYRCTVTAPSDSICNLLDDDCDGTVDEDVALDAGADDAGCM